MRHALNSSRKNSLLSWPPRQFWPEGNEETGATENGAEKCEGSARDSGFFREKKPESLVRDGWLPLVNPTLLLPALNLYALGVGEAALLTWVRAHPDREGWITGATNFVAAS